MCFRLTIYLMGDPDLFARNEFRFFTSVSTRWGDCDMFGHVNNVQFLSYYETGRLEYFARVLDMNSGPDPEQTLIIADIHVNFLRQIHHPGTLDISTRISRLGNSSFDVDASIFQPGEELPVLTAKAVCVWLDLIRNSSRRIPDNVRQTIIEFEQEDLT